MGIGLTDDHLALATTVRRWVTAREVTRAARACLDAEGDELPPFWPELAELGWLGLAVSAGSGGQGYGVAEAAVVLEELGRVCAPGPVLATTVAAAAIDRWGRDPELARPLVQGDLVGGFAAESDLVVSGSGATVTGTVAAVWGGARAGRFVLPVADGERVRWCVLDRADVEVRELAGLDPTSRVAEVRVDDVAVADDRWLVLAGVDGSVDGRSGPTRCAWPRCWAGPWPSAWPTGA